jgi:Dyp-type peroxidase family
MAALELEDIQGDVVRSYGLAFTSTAYVFVAVGDEERGRAWLAGLRPHVTTARPWGSEKPESTLNVALTYPGLEALGLPTGALATFSQEFREGMAARAQALGDQDGDAPEHWEPGLGTGAAHVLVTINARSTDALERAVGLLREGIDETGLTVVHEQVTELLEGAREHFGFADGFAQPAIEGSSEERVRGGGVPLEDGGWRPLAPGEFVLGYEDEESRVDPRRRLPAAPAEPLGLNGTYMVWRKLRQDVAGFRRTLRDAARLYEGGDEEKLAAKTVGRWRDGSALVLFPYGPDARRRPDEAPSNDFRYAQVDADGRRCPVGAHIRRTNPRDALDPEGLLTFRHRMIRRGMPYGPSLPPGIVEDDGQERGLVFVCLVASISRQFESVQVQWVNDGNVLHLGRDTDFLLGDATGTGKMTVQGDPPFFLAPQHAYVTTRGGEYLFVPGLRALAAIADRSA